MYKRKGFSLIELLIVVAIVGILTAASTYLYKDYINRSKVAEIMANLAVDQGKFLQWFFDNSMPANAVDSANMLTDIGGLSVCSAEVVNAADCTFGKYGIEVGSDTSKIESFKIYMTPSQVGDTVEWVCSYGASTSTDGIELLPKECRQAVASSATAIY